MNEEFKKLFSNLSEKDQKEVANLIRFKNEVKYHDKQFEELLNQYIELSREYEQLKDRITNAIERLEALIIFWKKYNPIDNTMQVEQFNGVISLLKEDNKEEVDEKDL